MIAVALGTLAVAFATGASAQQMPLAVACRLQGGTYGLPPTDPVRIGRFAATLPAVPGCLLRIGPTTVFRMEVAPGEEAAPPHFANLAFGVLNQVGVGASFADVRELRRLLEEDARGAVAQGGSGLDRGQVIRAGQHQGQRLLEAEIGQDLPAGCIPVRLRSEQRGFIAFPGDRVAEFLATERYCVAGPDGAAYLHLLEVFERGDPLAQQRGDRVRAAGARFLDSVRLVDSPAPSAAAPRDVHCRMAFNGTHDDRPLPSFRSIGFAVAIPGGGWCRVDVKSGMATFIQDLPVNEEPAAHPAASAADRFYRFHLSVLRLGPEEWGAGRLRLRTLDDLRATLEIIVARERAGSGPYGPPVGTGRATPRRVELGPDLPGPRCINLRVEHETRNAEVVPRGEVLLFLSDYRYCLGPGEVTAVLVAQERRLDGDPLAAPRAAAARGVADAFFASLRWDR